METHLEKYGAQFIPLLNIIRSTGTSTTQFVADIIASQLETCQAFKVKVINNIIPHSVCCDEMEISIQAGVSCLITSE